MIVCGYDVQIVQKQEPRRRELSVAPNLQVVLVQPLQLLNVVLGNVGMRVVYDFVRTNAYGYICERLANKGEAPK